MIQAIVQPLVLQAAPTTTTPTTMTAAPATSFGGFSDATIGPKLSASTNRLLFSNVIGATASPASVLTIINTGTADLTISALTLGGADGAMFTVSTNPGTIPAGTSVTLSLKFAPPTGATAGIKLGTLEIDSNDANTPATIINLRGLAAAGVGGSLEPSLQRILDLYQIPDNVGDSNPDDTFIDMPAVQPNDEVPIQRLRRAAAGPVTITPLAVYALKVAPALRFGYYTPGYTTNNRTELFTVGSADAQTVNPHFLGATSFDPGFTPFSLYTTWPGFKNNDGQIRTSYSENSLNYWETNPIAQHKIRFYPMKNADGSIVANTYIFAVEDFNAGYDSNDLVGVISNVKRAARMANPAMGLSAGNGLLFNDRLVFSKAQFFNPNFPDPVYHDTETLTIRNTGANALNISSMSIAGAFAIVAGPTGATSVDPGASITLTIKFTGSSGGTLTGQRYDGLLTILSNDPTSPKMTVQLAGQWQSYPNSTPSPEYYTEPTAMQLTSLFGYSTQIVYSGQVLNTGGSKTAVGEEVLSDYWSRADATQPVSVRELAAFHTGDTTSTIRWFSKGSTGLNGIFTHLATDAQTILPRMNTNGALAQGSFSPSGAFAFKIDNEYSVDSMNPQDPITGNQGHDVRIYPARDRANRYIPNTWLLYMDYYGMNYDYQDNIYLIQNMKPSAAPAAPADLAASGTNANGILLQWAANPETNIVGYNIYRSTVINSGYTLINSGPVTQTTYLDDVPLGTYFYRVTAVNALNIESLPAQATTLRPQMWYTGMDIGGPTIAGHTTQLVAGSDFDIYGGGSDISGRNDHFHYAFGWQYGDFDVQVRITSLDNTDPLAKAGLMVRAGLTSYSRQLLIGATPSGFVGIARQTDDAVATVANGGPTTYPNTYVRLLRVGASLTGFVSNDGVNWTQIVSMIDPTLPDVVVMGMAVTGHSTTAGANASFRGLTSMP
ncbi:MAG TPA: choice-of-anchor D domain-containing protein [Tepidisphaeraceae bacterium]|nr:choice-of-anchor D domain-containing protein [Tepidisphaeraceae bacterium]